MMLRTVVERNALKITLDKVQPFPSVSGCEIESFARRQLKCFFYMLMLSECHQSSQTDGMHFG